MRKGRQDVVAELEAELETPLFPVEVSYVWTAWVRLRRRMASGMNGPNPIGWVEVDAFLRRSGVFLSADDVGLLEAIDDAFLASFSSGPSPEEQSQALRDSLKRTAKPREH